jgi:hypothetical protein
MGPMATCCRGDESFVVVVFEGVVFVVDVVVDVGDDAPVAKRQPRPGCANDALFTYGVGSGAMVSVGPVVVVGLGLVVVDPEVGIVVVWGSVVAVVVVIVVVTVGAVELLFS